jgi:outer membrane lipoprotein-sorting protein
MIVKCSLRTGRHGNREDEDDSAARRRLGVALLSLAIILVPSAIQGRAFPPAWVAFANAWAGIKGYSATITVYERKGGVIQNMFLDYTFRKPSSATMSVIRGPNAGVTLVWNGGSTVVAHKGSGLTAMFKRTFPLHDPQVTTIRGSSIDQLSFSAILAHALQTAGPISQSPGPTISGVVTDAVTLIPAKPANDTGLTREVVEISRTTHFPVVVLGYAGQTLVRTVDFSNVKLER